MREAKLEDLLSQLIHNLILENKAQHESHRELQAGQFVPRAYMSYNLLSCFYKTAHKRNGEPHFVKTVHKKYNTVIY